MKSIFMNTRVWPHVMVWEETERKRGTGEWKTVSSSNHLTIWWDYADTSRTKTRIYGAYMYDPVNLGIGIDTVGYIHLRDRLLLYINFTDDGSPDTTARVEYVNQGDTMLVIRNTSAEPVTEIRYRKIK